MAGVLARSASWPARELSLLTAGELAPASDAKLDELGKRFAKQAGVTRPHRPIQSVQKCRPSCRRRLELSPSGHDIMSLEMHYLALPAPGGRRLQPLQALGAPAWRVVIRSSASTRS